MWWFFWKWQSLLKAVWSTANWAILSLSDQMIHPTLLVSAALCLVSFPLSVPCYLPVLPCQHQTFQAPMIDQHKLPPSPTLCQNRTSLRVPSTAIITQSRVSLLSRLSQHPTTQLDRLSVCIPFPVSIPTKIGQSIILTSHWLSIALTRCSYLHQFTTGSRNLNFPTLVDFENFLKIWCIVSQELFFRLFTRF